jgi:hypothetical protein
MHIHHLLNNMVQYKYKETPAATMAMTMTVQNLQPRLARWCPADDADLSTCNAKPAEGSILNVQWTYNWLNKLT